MDRRQRKTRDAVFAAFTELLREKPYSSITVQDIIDRANVGRSTFYAHFETKDSVIEALCTEIFDHVFSEHLSSEMSHDFSNEARDLKTELTHVLYHLQDSRGYLAGLLGGQAGELFMRPFRERIAWMLVPELGEGAPGVPRDYLVNHAVCDFAETVRWWMRNPQYSPEDVCGFFLATTRF